MVEVVSCLERDGRPVFRDLRWGVYVVLKAPNDYARTCFKEYGLKTDASGWYAAMYKPYHLIGLELGISVLSAALRGEPTGQPQGLARRCRRRRQADIAAPAKRSTARAATRSGASSSRPSAALPRAHCRSASRTRCRCKRDIAAGEIVRWADVDGPRQRGGAGAPRDGAALCGAAAAIAAQ